MKFKSDKEAPSGDPFVIKQGKIKNSNIRNVYRLGWTEDSFIYNSGNKEVIGRTFNFSKINYIVLILLLFFSFIFLRAAWLQLIKGEYYLKMAEGNRIRIERIEPRRGIIYDRNQTPLVRNKANFLLYLVPSDLPKDEKEIEKIIGRISGILVILQAKADVSDKSESKAKKILNAEEISTEIRNKLSKIKRGTAESYQPLFIADNIEYDKAMSLYLESANWKGVVLSNKIRREYLLTAQSLSHVLGYTGKISESEIKKYGSEYLPIDYIGKTGLEDFWENELKGVNGKKQIEVDALGKEKKIISMQGAIDGNNLILSLDEGLQKKIEDVSRAAFEKLRLSKGSIVALDPNNGEILAMVNLPAYDDNIFARGITVDEYSKLINDPDKPLFNRSVSGEYPSGSTIKPVMAAASLQEGIINESTAFLSNGGIRINQWFFPDWKGGGHGMTNVTKAIAESVNTFFYIIGGGYQDFKGLGVDRIIEYEKLFGLGTQTGIDLPGEATGFLPSKEWKEKAKGERWYIGDTYHLAIGQGDLNVTPLQVANYTAYFANGGKIYQPHLVKKILSSDEKQEKAIEANVVRQNIIYKHNLDIVRQGMRQTVVAGSARSLQDLPVAAAGKTGTAQWSTKKAPHAWFTGFAPYDKPQIVLTILVEEGKEGSSVAVPIAKEVFNWYFSRNKQTVIENKDR